MSVSRARVDCVNCGGQTRWSVIAAGNHPQMGIGDGLKNLKCKVKA